MKYDYLLVGAGLFSAVFAFEATRAGKKCLVLERRNHIGGNCFTKKMEDIDVHVYGAHIFRTSDKKIWNFMNQFSEFNHFINSPVANYKGELYNLPFNMNTFHQMWGCIYPNEALSIIEEQRKEITHTPENLEEKAISLVGRDIYEKLIKGYTEKQWGRPCTDLPESIIRRLPVRLIYDNNYFNDPYQGIPTSGYTAIFEKMFAGCDVQLNVDYNKNREQYDQLATNVIYTGPIDELFDFCFGKLKYRSLKFETEVLDTPNLQGVAVMNFTDRETPYTRRIEHKHFVFGNQNKTVVSYEYPLEWEDGIEPYYPINDLENNTLYSKYRELTLTKSNFYVGGRLGEYRYYDMQDTIASALNLAQKLIHN